MSSSSSFFVSELRQALSEQSFGISGSRLGAHSCHEARASIDLLEGIRIEVRLSIQGYELCNASAAIFAVPGSIFESLDTLLSEASPKYRSKHADLLFARLSS